MSTALKQFKDFNIKPVTKGLEGDKIKIDKILNREITVHAFKIGPSKYPEKGNGLRLDLQISLGETKHIVWSGSGILMDMIKQVPDDAFPFQATIVKENERLEFR